MTSSTVMPITSPEKTTEQIDKGRKDNLASSDRSINPSCELEPTAASAVLSASDDTIPPSGNEVPDENQSDEHDDHYYPIPWENDPNAPQSKEETEVELKWSEEESGEEQKQIEEGSGKETRHCGEESGEELNGNSALNEADTISSTSKSAQAIEAESKSAGTITSTTDALSEHITSASSDTNKDALKLLRFDDDPEHYDGDALWLCVVKRCWIHFKKNRDRGAAVMSLQRLRIGKNSAEAEFQKLCNLANHHEDFCQYLQQFLGLLESYPGNSILDAPIEFMPFSENSIVRNKPQDSCLTCIKKGRTCYGTETIESRCSACRDAKKENNTSQFDDCYWVKEEFGILTYEGAQDFMGHGNNGSKTLKRKAEDGNTQKPSKIQKPAPKFIETNFSKKTPARIQRPCGDDRTGHLPSARIRLRTQVDGRFGEINFDTFAWTNLKAGIIFWEWKYINWRDKTVKYYRNPPKHSFGVIEEEDGEEKPLTEVEFVRLNRDLRFGKGEYFKKKGLVFCCKARPGANTSK